MPRSSLIRPVHTLIFVTAFVACGPPPPPGEEAQGHLLELPGRTSGSVPERIENPEFLPKSSAFPMGVSVGDVTFDRALFWTRYTGPAQLELVVWEMVAKDYAGVLKTVPVTLAEGGYAHVDVDGLPANRRLRYAFFELSGGKRALRSVIGRFRTALAPNEMEPLVIGAVSCVDVAKPLDVLSLSASHEVDAFMYLGDTSYNDGAKTKEEYRAAWARSFGKPEYIENRASTSIVATWDDHEIVNDWAPESIDPTHRAVGTAAFFEHMPVRRDPVSPDRIYRKFAWGKTVEFFVLDAKSERYYDKGEYLSPAQLAWLKQGLSESKAVFKVLLNSVPMGDFPIHFLLYARKFIWQGFPTQRDDLLGFIEQQKIGGVMSFAGDFHLGMAGRVTASGVGSKTIEVMAGPGAKEPNPALATVFGARYDFVTGINNYVALHLDPVTKKAKVKFHSGTGQVIFEREYEP